MDAERWARIEDVFARALEVAPADQLAFVIAECGDDADLQREVASLLDHASHGGSLHDIVTQAARATPIVGEVIGERFAIETQVGEGGMGTVYRATDRDGGVVAVKVLSPLFGADDQTRFVREARMLADLDHPGIVRYVAHGIDARHGPFLAMEWLAGEDLAARLARAPLTVDDGVHIARQVANALAHAHARGVVHRDIKPSNIWIADDVVKVLDFGIARAHDASTLTGTNAIIGTVGYMAPEQARGARTVDGKADLFSLGCVLYECVTGTPAFTAKHMFAVLMKVLQDQPRSPRELRPELPVELDRLVMNLLDKDASRRPADALAVAAALEPLDVLASPG